MILLNIYLAIDIGASSGRHIAAWKEDGILKTEEEVNHELKMSSWSRHSTTSLTSPSPIFIYIDGGF